MCQLGARGQLKWIERSAPWHHGVVEVRVFFLLLRGHDWNNFIKLINKVINQVNSVSLLGFVQNIIIWRYKKDITPRPKETVLAFQYLIIHN